MAHTRYSHQTCYISELALIPYSQISIIIIIFNLREMLTSVLRALVNKFK